MLSKKEQVTEKCIQYMSIYVKLKMDKRSNILFRDKFQGGKNYFLKKTMISTKFWIVVPSWGEREEAMAWGTLGTSKVLVLFQV